MTLQIYNTLSREKEVFKPKRDDSTKVYYCGPTPYNFAHIGNLKTYVFEDIVVRTLRFLGFKVTTTMNITDIDDKTIRDSQKAGQGLLEFTKKYSDIFFEDLHKLSIIPADNIKPISELIPEMIHIINTLLKKQYAYISDDGSVYYSIKKFKNYGKLALLDFSGMKSSVRINNDEYEKDNIGDFVLWKAHDTERDGKNFWEGKFQVGEKEVILLGRPGWHIECSACNLKYFGAEIDLHMGGVDLIFPHHQNEIAQTEGCTGKTFSRYWMHGGHLTVDGKKMSKSLGNFYTLRDIEEKFQHIETSVLYRAIRLSFISGKYRESVDFSYAKLEQQINTIKGIDETIKKLKRLEESVESGKMSSFIRDDLQQVVAAFIENLEDDINTPECLSVFFEFQRYVNAHIATEKLKKQEILSFIDMFKTFDQIFGIMRFDFTLDVEIPQDIAHLLEERNSAKKEKNFSLSDEKRKQIEDRGYKVIDDRNGTRVEKI